MHFPLKFENIKIIYTSKFEIYEQYKIIVDDDGIIFWAQNSSSWGIKKLNYKGFEIRTFNYYPNIKTIINWNVKPHTIKPQDYRIVGDEIYYFFSKNCYLFLFNYYDKPKWDHYSHKIYFSNLEDYEEGNCVLEIAFNDKRKDEIAVYNLNSNKIIVINLNNEIKNNKQNEIQVTMEKIINQALIYSDEKETKLIGIDFY